MKKYSWILWLMIFAGCASEDFEPAVDYYSYFDFVNGIQTWEADIGNYHQDLKSTFELSLIHQNYFMDGESKNAMELKLSKVPDQSFVYLRNKIKGLKPDTRYELTFEIQQQYNFNLGVNLSDAPDTILYKAGFSNVKPESVEAEDINSNTNVVLNIEMPNPDVTYSSITIIDNLYPQKYDLRTLDNFKNPLIIKTDHVGEFWFIYGSAINDVFSYSILFDTFIFYYEEL